MGVVSQNYPQRSKSDPSSKASIEQCFLEPKENTNMQLRKRLAYVKPVDRFIPARNAETEERGQR